MKVCYRFPINGVEGDVTVTNDGTTLEVTVEPYFYSPKFTPPAAFVQTLDSKGNVLHRETQVVSGATGALRRYSRNQAVAPAIDQPPAKSPKDGK